METVKVGDIVKHKKDGYTGIAKSIDNKEE